MLSFFLSFFFVEILSLACLIKWEWLSISTQTIYHSLYLKIKEVEIQFAIGECLSFIGAGQSSKVFKQYYNIKFDLKCPKADVMESLIQKMTKEIVQSPLAMIRQSGIIWLLSMVQFSGEHAVLKQEIKEIQKAFMKCLCDSDEITQDVASRGKLFCFKFFVTIINLLNSVHYGND